MITQPFRVDYIIKSAVVAKRKGIKSIPEFLASTFMVNRSERGNKTKPRTKQYR